MKATFARRLLVALLLLLTASAANAQDPRSLAPVPTATARQVSADYGKLPLAFEPNLGQTAPSVQFISRGAGYTIFLSPTSAEFVLRHAVVGMQLLAANSDAELQAQDKLPGVANYLLGNTRTNWHTNLPTYAKTRTRSIYPLIDLVYYGNQGRLEYDFVLSPHADPSQIRLKFTGATPVVDPSGDLVLHLNGAPPSGSNAENAIRFHRPNLYQESPKGRQAVAGGFTVARNEVTFQVGDYDHARELVIDPVLVYSSYLGGSSQQSVINAMAIDAAGHIYVTGATNALDYPTTSGVIQGACPTAITGGTKCGPSSASAAFVSKISADGQSLLYSTYLGGSGDGYGAGGSAAGAGGNGNDLSTGIAVDSSGNAWVVGQTNSNNFPITPDAYSLYCEPAEIASGAYIISVKGNGCGGPNASGYYYNGTYSLFLVKLNPTGTSMLYGTFLGGTNGELAAHIALDAAGNIYIAGSAYTNAPGTFAQTSYYNYPTTASAFQTQALTGGSFSAFVTEMTPDGRSLVYSSMFGGPNQNTYNSSLAIGGGKIFIGGSTTDPHLPMTPGAISTTCLGGPTAAGPDTICQGGYASGWVAEFDPSKSGAASLVFSTYLNGSTAGNASSVTALAADSTGSVYVAGNDAYPEFPTTPGVLQPACIVHGGCDTGFVTKLGSSGGLVWSTFYGSPSTAGGNQTVSVIALDANHNVYIAANATGLGDYPLHNGFQNYTGGSAYITELSSDGSQVLFGSFYGGQNNVFPTGLAIGTNGNIYLAGYTAGDLPLVNALQSTNGGGYNEGFFARISNPVPAAAVFVSAASSQSGPVSPGSIVSVYAADLATATGSAVSTPLPVNIAGTTVTIVDSAGVSAPAALFFVSPGQVNFQIPAGVALGAASITVTSADGASSAGNVMVSAVAPGLFVVDSAGLVAAEVITVAADGTQVSGNSYQVLNGAIAPLPVNLGPPSQQVFLVLYGTGISGRSSLSNVSVSIAGQSLPAVYAGPQGDAGLDQVNVQLPASLAGIGDTTLSVAVDGIVSNNVHLTIM